MFVVHELPANCQQPASNAFDAEPHNVGVVLTADLHASDATIAVFDDGGGMDPAGLKIHRRVGDSIKRLNRLTTSGRRTIGSDCLLPRCCRGVGPGRLRLKPDDDPFRELPGEEAGSVAVMDR
jgi:hypothetical protein